MALMIARCPACATRFKVVPDQLRMSQGWVRCGQCSEIFDAGQQVAQAGSGAPGPAVASPPRAADAPQSAVPLPAAGAAPAPVAPSPSQAAADADLPRWLPHTPAVVPSGDSPASLGAGPAGAGPTRAGEAFPQEAQWTPALHRASTQAARVAEDPAAPAPPRLVVTLAAESAPMALRAAAADAMPMPQRPAADVPQPAPLPPPRVVAAAPVRPAAPLDPAHAELSFLREAAQAVPQATARTPRARVLWVAVAALALLVLAWQLAVHERDRLAAAAPGLRPLLGALCVPLGCSVQPLRRIEAIVIDGSSFQALGESGYRLSLTLRNRAPHPVALPAVVLALTDIAEQPVVRRVLLPADFGTPPQALAPHGEWAASVELQMADNAGRARVVGYRLDPFYP